MYLWRLVILLMLSVGWASPCLSKADTQGEEPGQENFIELEGPNQTPAAQFVQDVLERAYQQIGYQVRYRQIPLARSFIEANKGEVDGLRARVATVAEKYPNLIAVPFEILDFSLVLLADRRICGVCDLSSIHQVAVTRGIVAIEGELAEQLADKDVVEVTSGIQSLELLVAGKVQAAIVPDTNVPEAYYELNHHWMKRTLTVLPDFHYLHKKHRKLVKPLAAELEAMQDAGVITQLREKYGLKLARRDVEEANLNSIKVISEKWRQFTDSAKGTYWQIMSEIYASKDQQVTFSTPNWQQAKTRFVNGESDILVGAYAHELGQGFIRSDMHLDYDFPVMAYGKNADTLEALLKAEQPFTVCFKPGYSFEVFLPPGAVITMTNMKVCREQLAQEKIDMVLEYAVNWKGSLKEGFEKVQLVEGRPLFLFFHDSPKGHKLKALFDNRYPQLVTQGKVKDYFPSPFYYQNANLSVLPQATGE